MSQTEDHLLSLASSDEVFIAFNRWVRSQTKSTPDRINNTSL